MFNPLAIGKRIREARTARGMPSTGALARALEKVLQEKAQKEGNKAIRRTLARQTVENWERGTIIPPWDKVEAMALVFGASYDEGWLMFGERRAEQLNQERSTLARITDDEAGLLQVYREANDQGRKSILASAKGIANDNPAPRAAIHGLRRKDDIS